MANKFVQLGLGMFLIFVFISLFSQGVARKSCQTKKTSRNLLTTLDTGGILNFEHYIQGVRLKKNSRKLIFFFSFSRAIPTIGKCRRGVSFFQAPEKQFSFSVGGISMNFNR